MELVAQITSMAELEERIAPLRLRLTEHPLYGAMQSGEQVHLFLESHVFAVWDFMWLLKSLQLRLTSVAVPWVPTASAESRRFINEIVLGEESDVYEGRAISHFELYLEAMREAGADTSVIEAALASARAGEIALADAPEEARKFVATTQRIIAQGSTAAQAAAFTFGREDVIPDMFRHLVRSLNERNPGRWAKLIWYLERHIEVDGDDHGPISLRMVADLCGSDPQRWNEAAATAEEAIEARIALWDGILARISR